FTHSEEDGSIRAEAKLCRLARHDERHRPPVPRGEHALLPLKGTFFVDKSIQNFITVRDTGAWQDVLFNKEFQIRRGFHRWVEIFADVFRKLCKIRRGW